MRTYARIECDAAFALLVTDGDVGTMFHSDLRWIDVTDVTGIANGWVHDGIRLVPPPLAVPGMKPDIPDLTEAPHI